MKANQEKIIEILTLLCEWESLAQIAPSEEGAEIMREPKKALEEKLLELEPRNVISESIISDTVYYSFAGFSVEKNFLQ